MRENGRILVEVGHAPMNHLLHQFTLIFMDKNYGGSFSNLIQELQLDKSPLTALDVVMKVIEVFPSFRDVTAYGGRQGQPPDTILLPFPVSDASPFSVLSQKSPDLGRRNMGRILPLPIFEPNTTPHIPRWRHPQIDHVRRLPRPTNPPSPQSPHVPASPPHPPRIGTLPRARVQRGGEHPGCEYRCGRKNSR